MRTYKVHYLTEQNDDCVDLEIIIKAENIFLVMEIFKEEVSVFKRVTKIEEIY